MQQRFKLLTINSTKIKMTSDPDFIHLIESKRFQTSGIGSPKNQARLKEQQKAYSNELISLRLVPPSSSVTLDNTNDNNTSSPSKSATTWNIPRFRLTQVFLSETVNRGRNDTLPKLHVTHLIDSRSKEVLLPSNDLRVQCRSSPVVYDVVTQLAGGIKNGGVLARSGDSYYNGDMLFLITNVPKTSTSELFEVQSSDVHRWLVECATSSVEKIMIANDKIQGLNETLQQLEKTLANVHKAPIYNDKTGRAITGEALQVAREKKRTSLLEETEQTKSNLAAAEQALNELRLKHLRRMELSIKKRSDDTTNNSNKIAFSVKLHGKKKEYYTSLITNQKDWSLPLYATGSDLGGSNRSSSNDTSELALLDITTSQQAQHFVDTGSVSIVVLPGE